MKSDSMVNIKINKKVFERLQSLAVPLVDDSDSIIERLIDHWTNNPPVKRGKNATEMWASARGEKLPVGLKLRANHKGHLYTASVLKSGIFVGSEECSSPSAAAIHAKNISGLIGSSASTNGWKFWEYYDEEANAWKSLETLRK